MGKNKKSTVNQNTNDLTVYKVGAAFALLVLALLALGRILNVYATGSTFDVVYRASQTVWTLCVILCAASVAAYIVLRKKSIRKVFPYVFVLSLLAGGDGARSALLLDRARNGALHAPCGGLLSVHHLLPVPE